MPFPKQLALTLAYGAKNQNPKLSDFAVFCGEESWTVVNI